MSANEVVRQGRGRTEVTFLFALVIIGILERQGFGLVFYSFALGLVSFCFTFSCSCFIWLFVFPRIVSYFYFNEF